MGEERELNDADRAVAFKALDWARLFKNLVYKAKKKWELEPALAKDLAQQTLTRFVQVRGAGWDYLADPTAWYRLVRKMAGRLKALHEQEERRQELMPIELDSEAVDATPPESDRGAHDAVVARQHLGRLRESLASAPLALAIVSLVTQEGALTASELAVSLGASVKDVYTALALLQRHIERIRAEKLQ